MRYTAGTTSRGRAEKCSSGSDEDWLCAEPLRQSAVITLIRAHLEEGNCYEAVRRYQHYRDMLRVELGVAPAPEMSALMVGLGSVGD